MHVGNSLRFLFQRQEALGEHAGVLERVRGFRVLALLYVGRQVADGGGRVARLVFSVVLVWERLC